MAEIHRKLLEQKLLRGIRAKRRFKAAVRHVIYNMFWIDDDDEDDIGEDSVKTTYRLARMRKKKGKGLTIKEKAVLRKHIDYRTEEEIAYLNKFIGGLKCFRPYPENVQLELVGVTYFEYYGPGRVLIRQNDEGHAMYFLLSGEVVVSRTQWDEIANVYVEENIATISPGKMFGELALLHNVPRTATCSTTAPCELLVLKKEDFDRVLKVSLMERWEAVRQAMTKFEYFDHWNNVAIRECCLLSKIKSFSVNQIVYGDKTYNTHNPDMTYFILEGSCSVVEHMYIEETENHGKKYYKYKAPPENKLSEETISKIHNFHVPNNTEIEKEKRNLSEKQISESVTSVNQRDPRSSSLVDSNIKSIEKGIVSAENVKNDVDSQPDLKPEEQDVKTLLRRLTDILHYEPAAKNDVKISNETVTTISEQLESSSMQDEKILQFKEILQRERRMTLKSLQLPKDKIPRSYKLVFVQVCTLKEMASFSKDSIKKNRRVIAKSPVKILLIPTYWLVQHNKANVWTRIDRFLERRIPSSETVFKGYVEHKKWDDYKKKLTNEVISKKKTFNKTTIHDVPYFVRIINNYD